MFKKHIKNEDEKNLTEKELTKEELMKEVEMDGDHNFIWGAETAKILGISRTTFYTRQREGFYENICCVDMVIGEKTCRKYYKKDVFRAAFPKASDEQLQKLMLGYNLSKKTRTRKKGRKRANNVLTGFQDSTDSIPDSVSSETGISQGVLEELIGNLLNPGSTQLPGNDPTILRLSNTITSSSLTQQHQLDEITAWLRKISGNTRDIKHAQIAQVIIESIPYIKSCIEKYVKPYIETHREQIGEFIHDYQMYLQQMQSQHQAPSTPSVPQGPPSVADNKPVNMDNPFRDVAKGFTIDMLRSRGAVIYGMGLFGKKSNEEAKDNDGKDKEGAKG